MRGVASNDMHGARGHFFETRLALFVLEQQKTFASQAKVDFPLLSQRNENARGS